MEQYLIYKITNQINQKVYIGLTRTGLDLRWKKHVGAALRCEDNSIFHYAIKKYRPENFKKEVLIEGLTLTEAYEKEKYYISLYDSFNKTKGYNMTLGGENAIQNKGENNGRSLATDEQRWDAIRLLSETDLNHWEIAQAVGYPGKTKRALEGFVSDLNCGRTFFQESISYPIRKEKKFKKGDDNPCALSKEEALNIINLLVTTNYSYTEIERQTGHNRHLISKIDNCQRYTDCHNYKNNIRKESHIKE